MKIIVELPDDTICGFINYTYGDMSGLTLGTLALDSERINTKEVSYKEIKNTIKG